MDIELPDYVQFILETLNSYDHAAYIVGGCVRDAMLGVEPHDWDICTDATPEQIKECFVQHLPIGEKYGTIAVGWTLDNGDTKYCEVTTFRADGKYSDGRRPDNVMFGKSIIDDLARRDFTINAMAYNPLVGLVDPFGGQEDLEDKIIRCVGDAQDRFGEDALRILRAIRFACKYKFELTNGVAYSLHTMESSLSNVSKERIHEELLKILTYSKDNASTLLSSSHVLGYLFEYPNYDKALTTYIDEPWVKPLNSNAPTLYKVWKLLTGHKELYEMEMWLRKYKFSNAEVKTVLNLEKINNSMKSIIKLTKHNIDYRIRVLLNKYDINDVETYYYDNPTVLQAILDNIKHPYEINDLDISGTDLMEIGYKGKQIGVELQMLLDKVLITPELNTFEQLKKIAEVDYGTNNKK